MAEPEGVQVVGSTPAGTVVVVAVVQLVVTYELPEVGPLAIQPPTVTPVVVLTVLQVVVV